ncbi:type II toxin-antitoxin system HipA family toxin [Frateuria sp. Soil773]|uniref:type II toxin-antitoxin system HipA family toxin n=1 Tax=Frateuria sp. Soil773 TaxID=1736407 RepID=UPI001F47A941|nr:type II toxin-antitoxin system HipA family toxin [Frateuria sp. Soil773]
MASGLALDIWMNGRFVGTWERPRGSADRLTYDAGWIRSAEGRPLSLSLPFGPANGRDQSLRGDRVAAYFENLIPDNERILQRLRDRYGARSTAPFDLLAAIGRDCVGAIQLLPAGTEPGDIRRVEATPLDEAGVANVLRSATALRLPGEPPDDDAFRLSIAGAQEKTALLRHRGRWCIPHGATPSTHIFKLPLGLVGNVQADMRMSVELEWLCMELVREYGLPVARVEIGRFEDRKALIVERFDRIRARDGNYWLRIPQEDFCQATGLPPGRKYESDGGPGIRRIMDILRGSENAGTDREDFFKAQLLFWIMAATDGHAKNFSLALLAGGRYRRTPLYDILSTWPIQGRGANRMDPRKARLAMAVEGGNRHYLIHDIHRWHWVGMAESLGLADRAVAMVGDLVERTPRVLDAVAKRLPDDFPAALFDSVADGMTSAVKRLAKEPDRRAGASRRKA